VLGLDEAEASRCGGEAAYNWIWIRFNRGGCNEFQTVSLMREISVLDHRRMGCGFVFRN
jgi:hypothetical protein